MLEKAVETIREVLDRHGVRPLRFYLFGSRARGDHRPDSDWDICVVLDRDLAPADRRLIITEIKRALARLRIPNDVVLKSAERFEALKSYPGSLAYDVIQEGVVL
jgi:predicted nucleotidyltransferase